MIEDILIQFFTKQYENLLNEKLFYRNFSLDTNAVKGYISELVKIPISNFLMYIVENCRVNYITYQDIIQFSSLKDSTEGVCYVLSSINNEGLTNLEVGELLLNDGKVRTETALRKYGENQAKTGIEFGLIQKIERNYYLTALGVVFNSLSDSRKRELLRRCILRNKFIQKIIIKAQQNDVVIKREMSFLSASTVIRRLSNVKKIYYLISENEKDTQQYFKNIFIK